MQHIRSQRQLGGHQTQTSTPTLEKWEPQQRTECEQQQLGWRSCIQYVRFPIVRDAWPGGQVPTCHEKVAGEYDIVLSPSDCGQEINGLAEMRITVAMGGLSDKFPGLIDSFSRGFGCSYVM